MQDNEAGLLCFIKIFLVNEYLFDIWEIEKEYGGRIFVRN